MYLDIVAETLFGFSAEPTALFPVAVFLAAEDVELSEADFAPRPFLFLEAPPRMLSNRSSKLTGFTGSTFEKDELCLVVRNGIVAVFDLVIMFADMVEHAASTIKARRENRDILTTSKIKTMKSTFRFVRYKSIASR